MPIRRLMCMSDTTIRVASATRDELRALAETDGVTLDEMLRLLAKRERQRRIGVALATHESDAEERAVLAAGRRTVRRDARR